MRFRFLCLSLFFASALSAVASGLEGVRIWPEYRKAESFERISEYLSGEENTGGQLVLRSQKDKRDGYYFLVRVKNHAAAEQGCTWQVEVILPSSPTPQVFSLPTDLRAGGSVYQLGVTGTDWPGAEIVPVAWKLTLKAADGRELVTRQSFLWSK